MENMEQNPQTQTPETTPAPQKRPAGQPPRKPAAGRPPQAGQHSRPAPDGQLRKPVSGKPPQAGQHSKPAPEGQHSKPAPEGQHSKPAAEGQHSKPVTEGQHSKPAAEGQHNKPAAEGQPPRRPVSGKAQQAAGQHSKPAPEGQPPRRPVNGKTPQAAGQHSKPAPDGQPPRRPVNGKPPQAADRHSKPAPNGQPPRRPVPPASQRHPAQPGSRPPRRPQDGQQPQGRRPVQPGARPADGQRRPPQNVPPRAPQPQNQNRGPKRTVNRFRVGMAIYISLAFILTFWGMHRLWNFLDEYEQSRPEHTIENYITHIDNNFYSQMIAKSVENNPLTQYETPETLLSTLDTGAAAQTYSWGKKADEYTDDKPVYFIRYGGAAIASVSLSRAGSTEKFDFPVWKTDDDPKSLIEISSEPQYSVKVTLPTNSQLTLNGIAVPMQDMTGCDAPLKLDELEQEYVDQPQAMEVEITGLYASPVVQVADMSGNVLTPETAPGEHDKKQTYVFLPADESAPDEALVARVESMTIAYKNYMINEGGLNETGGNLAALRQFLLANSNAMKMMNAMSGEVYWNNPYTNLEDKVMEVEHIRMYSPDLCTCESHLDYILTKVSDRGTITNEYNIKIGWTMIRVDDTWYASNMVLNQVEEPQTDEPAAEENEIA